MNMSILYVFISRMLLVTIYLNQYARPFLLYLAGYPKAKFQPLERRQSLSANVNHALMVSFDPKVTIDIITKLDS